MRNLIISDFKRIFKDTLFKVTLILCGAFAVFMPLLYVALMNVAGVDNLELFGFSIDAKTLFFQGFSLSNEVALVAIILFLIILARDFSYGTIRNKIIAGKKRSEIFLSTFITVTVSVFALVFLHALLTLVFSLFFFEYQAEPIIFADILYALLSILLELLIFVFIGALLSFLNVLTKSAGLSVLLFLGIYVFFSIVGAIASLAYVLLSVSGVHKFWVVLSEIFSKYNVFTSTTIGSASSYETSFVITMILAMLALTALLIFLGIRVFKNKDLK